MKFRLFLAALLSFFIFKASAAVLPKDHFLYPADTEINFLLGNVNSVSLNFAKRLLPKCDEGTAAEKYADLCRAVDWIRKDSAPADQFPWEKMTAQVLYFGEMHLGQESKLFLASHIADLKKLGIGALGLEMINSNHQDVLDRYHQNEASLEDVKAILESEWHYESAGYLKMIEAAHREGLRIIALDDRSHAWEGDFFESIHGRDAHMAGIIAGSIAKEPSLKIAVLCGRMHAFRAFSDQNLTLSQPAMLREQYHITTQSTLVFSEVEISPAGFTVMQKAVLGEKVSSVTTPPAGYAYTDFFLFLRNPATP